MYSIRAQKLPVSEIHLPVEKLEEFNQSSIFSQIDFSLLNILATKHFPPWQFPEDSSCCPAPHPLMEDIYRELEWLPIYSE